MPWDFTSLAGVKNYFESSKPPDVWVIFWKMTPQNINKTFDMYGPQMTMH